MLRSTAAALIMSGALAMVCMAYSPVYSENFKELSALAQKNSKGHGLTTEQWLPPGSIPWLLYNDKSFLSDLSTFLMPSTRGYVSGEPSLITKSIDYRGSATFYTTPRNTRVQMTILVPHPKNVDIALSWLLKDFKALKPDSSAVVDSYDLKLAGATDAKFYLTTPAGCRALIHAERGSLIALVADDCRRPSDVTEMAKLLTIEKFNRNLKDEDERREGEDAGGDTVPDRTE